MRAELSGQKTLRLGLIGGNITQSRAPALQIVCGLSVGRNVSYDLIIPDERGLTFEDTLTVCRDAGYDGVNITYPYKELSAALIAAGDPVLNHMGAANTVCFSPSGDRAFNTDYSGFISAYRGKWGETAPGRVLILGAGGVGRAVTFALGKLGAEEVLLFDTDTAKAEALVHAARNPFGGIVKAAAPNMPLDFSGMDGVINCTPLGMTGREGTPLPQDTKGEPRWAFDAVYTPEHTVFRGQVEALGASFLSGYELYLNQGLHAFRIFSGVEVSDPDWVRATLHHGLA
jgi:shikimate dehydrogenase